MTTIAVYSGKGGVGKTSLAVNLAWASATLSARRTLLWDLDAQAAASFILAPDRTAGDDARAVIERDIAPDSVIVKTGIDSLNLLPADASLRSLDQLFADLGRGKRLLKIGEALAKRYDRIIVDCPPGFGITADHVIRGAALIVLPVIPSALAMRSADELVQHLGGRKGAPPILPVFNLVDKRRLAHRAALAAEPDRWAVPMASMVEQMAQRHAPLGVYASRSLAAQAVAGIWADIEQIIAKQRPAATAAPDKRGGRSRD